MTETARKPAVVAGAIIGVIIAALFAWLFGVLASVSVTSAPIILTLILLAGWALYCALSYGPELDGPDED
jgi:hypothetical protein